ncbi:MAG: hypothetical protein ACTHOF_14590 [Flavisolibacter sp.]|jgi:hypothetical protein
MTVRCALATLRMRSNCGSGPFLHYFLGKQKVVRESSLKAVKARSLKNHRGGRG